MNHEAYGDHDASRLNSTGKSAKKRRGGVIVEDDEAEAQESDDEDDLVCLGQLGWLHQDLFILDSIKGLGGVEARAGWICLPQV